MNGKLKRVAGLTTALIGAGAGLLVFYGFAVEPRLLAQVHHDVVLPGLPPAWDGRSVSCMGDWQLGMWMDNESTAEKAVAAVVAHRPAAVVLLGDFIYHTEEDEDDIRDVAAILAPLKEAGIPTYAVLGNHDYSLDKPNETPDREKARLLKSVLEEEGVKVLINEAVVLDLPPGDAGRGSNGEPARETRAGDALYLVGIGSHWMGLDHVEEALRQVPDDAPRIACMHNPDTFESIPARAAPLAMAGHTHGGQVRLPGFPDWSYLTFVKEDRVHADGWISDFGQAGNRVYVNRGIGFSNLPLRLFCRPELTWFTLHCSRSL